MVQNFNITAGAINQELADDIVSAITELHGTMKGHCKEFGVLYTTIAQMQDPGSKAYPVASQDPEQTGTTLFDHIAVQIPGAPQIYDRTGALNTSLRVLPDPSSQEKVKEMIFGDDTLQARLDTVLSLLKAKYPALQNVTAADALQKFRHIVDAGASVSIEGASVDLLTRNTLAYAA